MGEFVASHRSIITRLTLVVTGILITAVLAVGSLALVRQHRQLHQALAAKGNTLVEFMAQVTPLSILSLNFVEMNNEVTKVVQTDDEAVYAILLNEHGIPLVQFFKEADPAITLEVREHLKNRKPLAAVESMKRTARIVEVTAPIVSGERRIGSATLGFSTNRLQRALFTQMTLIGGMLVAIIVSSAALLRVVLLRILHPVKTLTSAAIQISLGDLNISLPRSTRVDELGVLSQAFETMTRQLRNLVAGLERRECDLRQINILQRTILDNAAYGIISTDPDGVITSFNHAAERMLGYTAAEVIGRQTPAFWHDPDEVSKYALQLSKELGESISPGFEVFTARPSRGLHEEHEWTFIQKDGGRLPVILSISALRSEEGNISGFVGMTYDLTERKRDEASLHRLNRELRAISDCNQVLVRAEDERSLLDDICRIVCDKADYSAAWVGYIKRSEVTTVQPVAMEGTGEVRPSASPLTYVDDVEHEQEPIWRAIHHSSTICVQDIAEELIPSPWRDDALQRGYRSSLVLPIRQEGGDVFGVFLIFSSRISAFTTEEIRLLEELAGDLAFGINVLRIRLEHQRVEEQISRLAAIVESSDDAIVGKNLDGIITSWNQGAEQIYGYTASEVVGKPIAILCPSGQEDELPKILSRIKSGEHIKHYESVRQRKDGQLIHMSLTISPVYGPQGQVISASAVGRDITERARLEEQLRQSQKMEAIGQLAGGVAHDFNNILTAIIGFTSIVRMKMQPGDPQRPLIEQILTSSDRAAQLTQGLLAFSRKQVLISKPVDLNIIVKSIERLLGRLIGEDIEFNTRLTDGSLIVMADAGQIEQVLMNLATNARDAMPSGGELSISTELKMLGTDYVETHGYGLPGAYALITVSDTGIGMDQATIGKIFEPFFTTKEPGKGTGLGLSMVYGIIKQHEGNISVYSELGKGTTFRILLPLVSMEVEDALSEADATPSGGTETLLLAEDDPDVRTMATMALTEAGYRVLGAVDGKDALETYKSHSKEIDLLILDVIMPKVGGKEVYDVVKATNPDAKILFMSGYTADALHKKGIFGAGVQFLAKPMSPIELLKKVRGILDGE